MSPNRSLKRTQQSARRTEPSQCLTNRWSARVKDKAPREALLKFVIVAAIFLCAGPELVAALELQILLELLGATLFVTAFIAGAKLAFLSLVENFRSLLLPVAPVALIFVAYIDWWLASAATCIASVHGLWAMLA